MQLPVALRDLIPLPFRTLVVLVVISRLGFPRPVRKPTICPMMVTAIDQCMMRALPLAAMPTGNIAQNYGL